MNPTFEEFILALESEMQKGARAEQALRIVVTNMAQRIHEAAEQMPQSTTSPEGISIAEGIERSRK
jgi:hypothetical protein